jgi:NADPH:quinone reductase-like Zn-dependent oxidoreductase
MKAWVYSSVSGQLDVKLEDFQDPDPKLLQKNEVIVKVLTAGVNPADYKVPEMGLVVKLAMGGYPAIPGYDFAGVVHATHSVNDAFQVGQKVFGRIPSLKRIGTYGEYTVTTLAGLAALPEGVDLDQAAGLGTAAQTSYQALVPYIKSGDKVLINGSSGGTGTYAVQIAKARAAHVTAICSTTNIGLVKELGADEVLDYKTVNILDSLLAQGPVYDHVLDNIGNDPRLYRAGDKYMKPGAKYIQVGLPVGGKSILDVAGNALLPSFLGGGKRSFKALTLTNAAEDLKHLGEWMKEGKLRTVIEEIYEFEDVPSAIAKVREGRTKGKVLFHVAKE